jgi:hypothetical protein
MVGYFSVQSKPISGNQNTVRKQAVLDANVAHFFVTPTICLMPTKE